VICQPCLAPRFGYEAPIESLTLEFPLIGEVEHLDVGDKQDALMSRLNAISQL
jgi:hypothetical protein